MKPLLCFRLTNVVLVLALFGCASTPPTRFHSLLSTSAPASQVVAPQWSVDLAAVSVPPAVDQTQWVVRMPDDSLRILEHEQWVAPLREELRAAVLEGLMLRYGAMDARTAPATPATHSWRVQLDVQRFESIVGKEVWLDSTWSATPMSTTTTHSQPLVCRSSVREIAAGDLTALAAAHRRAVVRLTNDIGQRLQAWSQGKKATCAD